MRVRKSEAPIGAEIFDIDLSEGVHEAAFKDVAAPVRAHDRAGPASIGVLASAVETA